MKKKTTVHLSAAVLAAFLAWPANAEDSAPAPAKAPDPTAAASAVPAVAPAAGAERPRIEPRLADTPEEKEHARRMAAIATLRDTKTQEDNYRYVIDVYDSGKAYIRVRGQLRDAISFEGDVDVSLPKH